MQYTNKGALSSAPKLLTAFMLSTFLVACGGGTSGDGTTAGTDDAGLDAGGDAGGLDGADDIGDFGLDDDGGDIDGGETDDGFVAGGGGPDSNGNGISDDDELLPCFNRGGSDEDSSNFLWNDNCHLAADINPGEGVTRSPWYNSTYSQGIQRVLYCSGAAGVAASNADFSDGFFGPNTGEAVRVFQQNENDEVLANQAAGMVESRGILEVDGIVGPQTWARLQSKVEDNAVFLGNEDNGGSNYDVFGVLTPTNGSAVDCSTERNFMGLVSADALQIEGWRLTNIPGGTGINTFSIDTP